MKSYDNEVIRAELEKYYYGNNSKYNDKEIAKRVLDNYIADIRNQDAIPTEVFPLYFRQDPTPLIKAVTLFKDSKNHNIPLFDENGEVKNVITLDAVNNEIVYADIDESIYLEYPTFCNDLLTDKYNAAIEDKIVSALETETNAMQLSIDLSNIQNADNYGSSYPDDLYKASISKAIQSLNKKAKRNASIVVPFYIYPLIPSELINKYNVIKAECNNIYIGDMKSIVVTHDPSKVEKDKAVKNGLVTLAINIRNLNSIRTYDNSICKIEL